MSAAQTVRGIVRIAGRDLNGNKPLIAALRDIKGINFTLAYAIVRMLRLDPSKRLGMLSEQQIQSLESAINNLNSLNLPSWMFNRRKDLETGEDRHLIESELLLTIKQDIEREKVMNSWRGFRHSLGLKVRGQRTRTTGRKGMTVGVRKKATAQQQQQKEKEGGK